MKELYNSIASNQDNHEFKTGPNNCRVGDHQVSRGNHIIIMDLSGNDFIWWRAVLFINWMKSYYIIKSHVRKLGVFTIRTCGLCIGEIHLVIWRLDLLWSNLIMLQHHMVYQENDTQVSSMQQKRTEFSFGYHNIDQQYFYTILNSLTA